MTVGVTVGCEMCLSQQCNCVRHPACTFCVGGVSFEDDINMEDELSMTVEEQLQCSLDSLRDDVIRQHIGTQPTAAAESGVFCRSC